MFKLNIRDMLWFLLIMITLMSVMFGLDYMGVDLSAPINLPSDSTHPSMSPTGAMSGTIS